MLTSSGEGICYAIDHRGRGSRDFSAQHFKNSCLHAAKFGELKMMNIDLQIDLSKARKEKCCAEGHFKKAKSNGSSQKKHLNESKEQNSVLHDELLDFKNLKWKHNADHEGELSALQAQLNKSKESDRRLIVASTAQLQKECVMWQALHFEVEKLLSKKSDEVYDVKQRSRLLIKQQYNKAMERETKLLEKVEELGMINIHLQVDCSIARKEKRQTAGKLSKAKATTASCLECLKES